MADQFLGEIRIFAGNFAPAGWAFCNGQILPIAQNSALFSLLGTFYGGNGTSNFALPNLQGNFPMCQGGGAGLTQRIMGETDGSATVTLLSTEMPNHSHNLQAALSPTSGTAGSTVALAPTGNGASIYHAPTNLRALAPASLASAGGDQPHENRQPYLALNFIIALTGIFPPRA